MRRSQVQRYFDIGEDGEPVPVGKQHIVCSICKERGHVQRECKLVIVRYPSEITRPVHPD